MSLCGGALLSFMGVPHVELVTFVPGNRSLCLGGESHIYIYMGRVCEQ